MTSSNTFLVTGGSGYLGTRVISELLQTGARVRATVRSLDSEPALREAVRRGLAEGASGGGSRGSGASGGGAVGDAGLEVVVASLTDDAGWDAAASGVEGVYHLASPMTHATEDRDLVVTPARDGALRVLRAARDAGARRVVLTSSFAAVGYSPKPLNADGVREYDENDWTSPETPGLPAYPLSKTVAERAAWDFVAGEGAGGSGGGAGGGGTDGGAGGGGTDGGAGGGLELVVLNPTWIAGPTLTSDARSSLQAFSAMLGGHMPLAPRQRFGVVDVRDAASAHLAAMSTPDAAGKRYLLLADGPTTTWLGVAALLHEHFGEAAAQAPTAEVPGDELPPLVIHNERAKAELGFRPRPMETTIVETVEGMRQLGMLG